MKGGDPDAEEAEGSEAEEEGVLNSVTPAAARAIRGLEGLGK